MEGHNRPLPVRQGDDKPDPLDALRRRPDLRQEGKASSRAKTTWLERFRDSDYARAKQSQRFSASKDRRKWDWRKLGYADKCHTPRDYSKPISPELERFYGEED